MAKISLANGRPTYQNIKRFLFVWYTKLYGTENGCSDPDVYEHTTGITISQSKGSYSTAFYAEVYEIVICAKENIMTLWRESKAGMCAVLTAS